MRVDFVTIFPGIFPPFLEYGLLHQATGKGILEFHVRDLRDFTRDKHKTVDDVPYGGGPGMVFKPEPIFEALDEIRKPESLVILPDPQGERFTSSLAQELSAFPHLIFVCGRYEGVDERVKESLVHREISIGDYVTMGGELPSLLMVEAITRFIPGVVGRGESVTADSFEQSLLDFPHYTRPEEYRGMKVPEVLLSGHHENIRKWRRKMVLKRTLERRKDLLQEASLSSEDRSLLQEIRSERERLAPQTRDRG